MDSSSGVQRTYTATRFKDGQINRWLTQVQQRSLTRSNVPLEDGSIRLQTVELHEISDDLLQSCADLFFTSYATWGPQATAKRAGKAVKTTVARLRRDHLFAKGCSLTLATNSTGAIVGYLFSRHFRYQPLSAIGEALWLTQLVVSPLMHGKGIAVKLIKTAMAQAGTGPSAVGLITNHPHAVRALESATRKEVSLEAIERHGPELMVASHVPYLRDVQQHDFKVNTEFYVDHSEVLRLIEQQSDWKLGPLGEGEEFVALVLLDNS